MLRLLLPKKAFGLATVHALNAGLDPLEGIILLMSRVGLLLLLLLDFLFLCL